MLANFIHLYLPHYTSNLDRSHFAYMYLLPDIIGQHPALPSAVDALCMYHLGREYNDPNIVAKSKSIYGSAISRLASNLDKTNRYAPTGTLAAIILLAQCELNQGHSTNSYAWENHLQGALLLLESFEPLAWDTNEGRLLLQGLRYVLACQGLVKRKAIIFTRPEWQELVTGEGASDIWVSLMNYASPIPGQLEDTDRLFSSSPSHHQAERVLARALQLRSQLLNWYSIMTRQTAVVQQVSLASREWYEPTPYDADLGYVFQFQDCRSCYLVMQYKFFMMSLSVNIIQLYDSGLVEFVQDTLPSRAMIEQDAHDLAMDVARCIPTILDPATPSVSRFNGAISIKLAGEYFYNNGLLDRAYWCREMGLRLQRHSFHVPETVKLRLPDDES